MPKLDKLATQRPTDHPGPKYPNPHAATLPARRKATLSGQA